MRLILANAVMLVLAATGCGSDTAPTTSAPELPSLTGIWTGDVSVEGTPARMTWTLTQRDTSVTGPVLVVLPTGTVLLNGMLSGTLSATTVAYVIAVSPDGIPSQPACTGQLAGSVTTMISTRSASTLVGTYSVSSSTCRTALSSGTFTLTRSS